jgi:hypothetical protein
VRREVRWALAAGAALALGATCAAPYTRLAAPYYAVAARLIAAGKPWKIVDIRVSRGEQGAAATLRLVGEVRRVRTDPIPGAIVTSRLQAGAVFQTPVIFWTLLGLWPAKSMRQRAAYIALGIVVFLGLEVATTVCQLVNPLSDAAAVLAGDFDPLTPWERWSRFIEAGGRVVLGVCAAIFTAAVVSRIPGLKLQSDAATCRRNRAISSPEPSINHAGSVAPPPCEVGGDVAVTVTDLTDVPPWPVQVRV